MSKAGKKILEGLSEAVDLARVQNAIDAWLDQDIPYRIGMAIGKEDAAKLVDRICGSKTTFVEVEKKNPEQA